MEEIKTESPLERMATDIQKIREGLERLRQLGIAQELMEIYICHKTKLGRYKVKAVLDAQKEFLKEAITKR